MDLKEILKEHSAFFREHYLPHLSIDCVVFGFQQTSLKVLLLRLKGQSKWALPGGYIRKDQSLNEAAAAILAKRTGVTDLYLQQFRVFGEQRRSEGFFADYPDDLWHKQRFITIGFYALVNFEDVVPVMDETADACEWVDVMDIPEMMMDHRFILDKALLSLRKQLNYKPIGYNLLGEKFTMPELQKLYEIILGKPLNRGNFYRKMLKFDILVKHNEIRKGTPHKAPILYSFDLEKYQLALSNGLQSEW